MSLTKDKQYGSALILSDNATKVIVNHLRIKFASTKKYHTYVRDIN